MAALSMSMPNVVVRAVFIFIGGFLQAVGKVEAERHVCCMTAILYPQPALDDDRPITFLSFRPQLASPSINDKNVTDRASSVRYTPHPARPSALRACSDPSDTPTPATLPMT
jgi:hypothetical protein